MTTSPDEKRPYSTAYGLGSTATESMASAGNVKRTNPVDGSTSVPEPTCVLDCPGRPPLMLTPPGTMITVASTCSAACRPSRPAYSSTAFVLIESLRPIVSDESGDAATT